MYIAYGWLEEFIDKEPVLNIFIIVVYLNIRENLWRIYGLNNHNSFFRDFIRLF